MSERVLVVEDDATIGPALVETLGRLGFDASLAADARRALAAEPADLILLDLGLPDMDGLALCRALREQTPSAVIVMLTGRADEMDVVTGLDAGADDYLVKPFRLAELVARVRAHLGRQERARSADVVRQVGDLRVDPPARRAWVAGTELPLRPRELDLLLALVARAGRVVTREELMDTVWDTAWTGSTRTLDMHVLALRRHLEVAGADPAVLVTVRGVGFRWETPA